MAAQAPPRQAGVRRAASHAAAPAEVGPDGGQALWSNLTGLLRPPWRRLLSGPAAPGVRVRLDPAGARISLWVPATIPPGPGRARDRRRLARRRHLHAARPRRRCPAGARRRPAPAAWPAPTTTRCAPTSTTPTRCAHCSPRPRAVLPRRQRAGGRCWPGRRRAAGCCAPAAPPPSWRGGRRGPARVPAAGPAHPRPGRTGAPAAAVASLPGPAAEIRAILGKAAGPRWAVAVRYAVASSGPARTARRAGQRLRGRAHALAVAPAALYTGGTTTWPPAAAPPGRVLAARRLGRGQLLSVPELAPWRTCRSTPPSPGWPGPVPASSAPAPGHPAAPAPARSRSARPTPGCPRPVAVSVADARHHLHVLGATGAGKSTLMANMVLADVDGRARRAGHRPQGRPDHRHPRPAARSTPARRTVLFDPDDAGPPPALNVLQRPTNADLTVDHLVGIFRKIFVEFWGPRTDDRAPQRLPDAAPRSPAPRSPTSPSCSATPPTGARSPPASRTRSCAASGTGTSAVRRAPRLHHRAAA